MTATDTHKARPGPATYKLGCFINDLLDCAADSVPLPPPLDVDDCDAGWADARDNAWDMELTKLELATLCARAVDGMGRSDCVWCGVDAYEIGEFYFVTDAIWDRYGPARGWLCIGCLEDHMGRRLTPGDFKDFFRREEELSERLRDRLGLPIQPLLFPTNGDGDG